MAKGSMGSPKNAFEDPKLTSPGGLVQKGGYLGGAARGINILSRPHFNFPIEPSKVGGPEQKLPKGMD